MDARAEASASSGPGAVPCGAQASPEGLAPPRRSPARRSPPRRTDDLSGLVAAARDIAAGRTRILIGIAGAPAAGKTTLAEALVAALAADPPPGCGPDWVAHVPMDGFHLADSELARLGRTDRKGAPDTFDVAGYAALLRRLTGDGLAETVYAPGFERTLDQPIAGSIAVPPACRIVVSEGNYLLLDDPGWQRVRAAFTTVWFVQLDPVVRRQRLEARHIEFGKTPEQATAWTTGPDERNARLVAPGAEMADLLITPR